jgi:hypothetical protein
MIRQMLDEVEDDIYHGFRVDQVEIIQDQNKLVRGGSQLVGQKTNDILELSRLDTLEHVRKIASDAWSHRLQGGEQISQKTGRVIITRVQRKPGGRDSRLFQPAADQRAFAVTSGGRHKNERLFQSPV